MAATMQQFQREVGPVMKFHFMQNRNSRSGYKEAMEAYALKKMPKANEMERKGFVMFALKVYDLMRASGLDPNTSAADVGAAVSGASNVAGAGGDWTTVGRLKTFIN